MKLEDVLEKKIIIKEVLEKAFGTILARGST